MSKSENTISQRLQSFVDNPITNLVKGVALLLIGLTDAFRTFRDDDPHGVIRVGHGLIIIGIFSILGALPHLIDSIQAYGRVLDLREEKRQAKNETDIP